MIKNKLKIIISSIISIVFVFYAFNFNPRNVAILATRSLGRQIFAYILNFVIFGVIIYLILSLFVFIQKKILQTSKSKTGRANNTGNRNKK